MKNMKIIVEKHPDGHVAYPLGLRGTVVAEGARYDAPRCTVLGAYPTRRPSTFELWVDPKPSCRARPVRDKRGLPAYP